LEYRIAIALRERCRLLCGGSLHSLEPERFAMRCREGSPVEHRDPEGFFNQLKLLRNQELHGWISEAGGRAFAANRSFATTWQRSSPACGLKGRSANRTEPNAASMAHLPEIGTLS